MSCRNDPSTSTGIHCSKVFGVPIDAVPMWLMWDQYTVSDKQISTRTTCAVDLVRSPWTRTKDTGKGFKRRSRTKDVEEIGAIMDLLIDWWGDKD